MKGPAPRDKKCEEGPTKNLTLPRLLFSAGVCGTVASACGAIHWVRRRRAHVRSERAEGHAQGTANTVALQASALNFAPHAHRMSVENAGGLRNSERSFHVFPFLRKAKSPAGVARLSQETGDIKNPGSERAPHGESLNHSLMLFVLPRVHASAFERYQVYKCQPILLEDKHT